MAADKLAAHESGEAPKLPGSTVQVGAMPADIVAGLEKLRHMAPPRITKPSVWPGIVADALRLVSEGWAAQALALGWTAGDLFGVGPRDDWDFEGLAVWLSSRKLVMIDARVAIAIDGTGRDYFERGGPRHGRMPEIDPVMLWDFGRG